MKLPQPLCGVLPRHLETALQKHPHIGSLEEIRLAAGQPLLLIGHDQDWLYHDVPVTSSDIEHLMLRLTQSSLYAYERELAQGFLTLPGGHRIGFCGTALVGEQHIRSQKEISAINIRLAREVLGCADTLLRSLNPFFVWGTESLLLLSPPGAGKTTMLRDLILALSEARPPLKRGYRIGIVDERSEVAATHGGQALFKLGPRAFVLNAAPKAEGLRLLLRAMSPQILATDELSGDEEWRTLLDLARSGVGTIFTAHGRELADIQQQTGFAAAVTEGGLHTIVILGRSQGPGSIEKIWHKQGKEWTDLVVQGNRHFDHPGGGFRSR